MQLTHAFVLPAPVDQVFEVFGQLDLLAPCFPGASVWGRDIEVYHGSVKITFGPFPLVFEGTARVVRVDVADHRMVVKANARDRRGVAAGSARVTATFRASGPDATTVQVLTELDLTGRPAQLGSSVISSVSDRLKDQFVSRIGPKLAAGLTAEQPTESTAPATTATAVPETAVSDSARAQSGRPSYTYSPPAEEAPHLQVLPDVARSWLPWLGAIGGVALLVFVVRRLRRR